MDQKILFLATQSFVYLPTKFVGRTTKIVGQTTKIDGLTSKKYVGRTSK